MKRTVMAVLIALACGAVLESCIFQEEETDPGTVHPGQLYNAFDGTCAGSGTYVSYYIDGVLVASVPPGEVGYITLDWGWHHLLGLEVGTDASMEGCDYDFKVEHDGWAAGCGCEDGTHP